MPHAQMQRIEDVPMRISVSGSLDIYEVSLCLLCCLPKTFTNQPTFPLLHIYS